VDLVRSVGADHVLGYTRDDFADGISRYDVLLDIAGNPALLPAAPRTHAHRDGRPRGRRGRRRRDGGHRPAATGASPVQVWPSAADQFYLHDHVPWSIMNWWSGQEAHLSA
jgi:hypothetical protein